MKEKMLRSYEPLIDDCAESSLRQFREGHCWNLLVIFE